MQTDFLWWKRRREITVAYRNLRKKTETRKGKLERIRRQAQAALNRFNRERISLLAEFQ